MRLHTRTETAEQLNVSPSRVSQLARSMQIHMKMAAGIIGYRSKDVARMKKRNTKPGPHPRTRKLSKGEK